MYDQSALYLDCDIQRQWHICQGLKALGLQFYLVNNIREAIRMLKKYHPHLALVYLDIGEEKTLRFCSLYRATHAHAILIVLMDNASVRTEELLFDYGASDVVAGEQVVSSILIRRIRVHLKKFYSLGSVTGHMRLGDIVVDFDRREIWRDRTLCRLPGILADLLKYFVDNPDRIITREELLKSHIWADSICTPSEEGGKTFDVHMSKLRKIIESDPRKPEIILTVRSLGWKLATQPIEYEYSKEGLYR